MEQKGNNAVVDVLGPKYGVTLDALRSWHVVRVRCLKCDHEGDVNPATLKRRWPKYTTLSFLEKQFRCRACGNRHGNSWTVMRLARNA